MKTLTAIQALEEAVVLMNVLLSGADAPGYDEQLALLRRWERALHAALEQDMKDERKRAAIRELAARRRASVASAPNAKTQEPQS